MSSALTQLDASAVATVLRPAAPPCVSLILDTPHGPEGAKRARLTLKNLLAAARVQVGAHLRSLETDELLAPAEALLVDEPFWHDTAGGLAIYLSTDRTMLHRLPVGVGDFVLVADEFAISPLVPLLVQDERYAVLSLSRNHARLYEGDQYGVVEMHVEHLPKSLDDALWYENHESQLDFHGGAHGGAAASDERKDQFERFFQKVDEAVVVGLRERFATPVPLVLAAVEREVSLYRSLSDHPMITETALLGNSDRIGLKELHTRSWEIVESILEGQRRHEIERFEELAGSGRTSDDAASVVNAAESGSVESLFVAPLQGDDATGKLAAVNGAVVNTMRHGGRVVPGVPGAARAGTLLAAILHKGAFVTANPQQ